MEYTKSFFVIISFLFFLLFAGCVNVPSPPDSQMPNQVIEGLQKAKTDYETRSGHASVMIKDFQFTPNPLIVPQGASVSWDNFDNVPHAIVFDDGSFWTSDMQKASGPESPGGGVTKRFDTIGEFPYHCKYHPEMQGTLVVVDRMQFTDECGNQFCGRNEEYAQNCPEDCPN